MLEATFVILIMENRMANKISRAGACIAFQPVQCCNNPNMCKVQLADYILYLLTNKPSILKVGINKIPWQVVGICRGGVRQHTFFLIIGSACANLLTILTNKQNKACC